VRPDPLEFIQDVPTWRHTNCEGLIRLPILGRSHERFKVVIRHIFDTFCNSIINAPSCDSGNLEIVASDTAAASVSNVAYVRNCGLAASTPDIAGAPRGWTCRRGNVTVGSAGARCGCCYLRAADGDGADSDSLLGIGRLRTMKRFGIALVCSRSARRLDVVGSLSRPVSLRDCTCGPQADGCP